MSTERELSISEIAKLPPNERLRAIRHRIATAEYEGQGEEENPEPVEHTDRHTIHLHLSEDEIELLYRLLDEKERQAKAILKRNEDFPTYNAKALRSEERQNELIRKIEYIRAQITDN